MRDAGAQAVAIACVGFLCLAQRQTCTLHCFVLLHGCAHKREALLQKLASQKRMTL